jgi:hypothetical protein
MDQSFAGEAHPEEIMTAEDLGSAAEPHPAARATITRNRPPAPKAGDGGEDGKWCKRSSWAAI